MEDKIDLAAVEMYFPIKCLRKAIENAMTQPDSPFEWRKMCGSNSKTTISSSKSTHFLRIHMTRVELYLHDGIYICRLDMADSKVDKSEHQECPNETTLAEVSQRNAKISKNKLDKPEISDSKLNVVQKRKRGRPRKIEPQATDNCIGVTTSLEHNTRYNLRGVKLPSDIILAEKGIYKNSAESKHYLENQISRESQRQQNKRKYPQETHIDIITSDAQNKIKSVDEEYKSQSDSDDENGLGKKQLEHDGNGKSVLKPQTLKQFTTDNEYGSLKRNYTKLDLGDKLPTFERRRNEAGNSHRKCQPCKICHKMLSDYTGVYVHVKNMHASDPTMQSYLEELVPLKVENCATCKMLCPDRFLLQAHEDRYHKKNVAVECNQCNKTFKNITSLRNHTRSVHIVQSAKSHLCHLCPAKFKFANTLKKHIDEIHEGNKHAKCDICGKEFYEKSQLKRHSRIHGLDESKRIFCQKCGKGFLFECNLQRHIVTIHTQQAESWHCSYCGKGFHQKSGLINHTHHTHFNLLRFSCSVCKQTFSRAAILKEHMATYHKQNNFKIDEYPKKNYLYNRRSEDMYHCMYCSEKIYSKAKLVEHIHGTHADAFPYQCNVCKQGYLERSYLHNHNVKAHGLHTDSIDEISDADVNMPLVKNRILHNIVTKPGHKAKVVTVDANMEKLTTTTMDVSDLVVDTVNSSSQPGHVETTHAGIEICDPERQSHVEQLVTVTDTADVEQYVVLAPDIAEQLVGQVIDVHSDIVEDPLSVVGEFVDVPINVTEPTDVSLVIEVDSGPTKYQYYIQTPETLTNENSVNIAHEFANLLLAAEQSLQASEKFDSNEATNVDERKTANTAEMVETEPIQMQQETNDAVIQILECYSPVL